MNEDLLPRDLNQPLVTPAIAPRAGCCAGLCTALPDLLVAPLSFVIIVTTICIAVVAATPLVCLLVLLLISFIMRRVICAFCTQPKTPTACPSGINRVVVTGGSSGIGKAIAGEFARRGAGRVTLVARSKAGLDAAVAELSAPKVVTAGRLRVNQTTTIDAAAVDVCSGATAIGAALFGECDGIEMGDVDVLVCAAGVSHPATFEQATNEQWEQTLAVNIMGCVNAIKAVLPGMKRRRHGQIVLISSMAGQVGIFGMSSYSASKFALRGLAEALRMECKPCGVTISLAFPPDTDTPMLAAENLVKPLETKEISGDAGTPRAL